MTKSGVSDMDMKMDALFEKLNSSKDLLNIYTLLALNFHTCF